MVLRHVGVSNERVLLSLSRKVARAGMIFGGDPHEWPTKEGSQMVMPGDHSLLRD